MTFDISGKTIATVQHGDTLSFEYLIITFTDGTNFKIQSNSAYEDSTLLFNEPEPEPIVHHEPTGLAKILRDEYRDATIQSLNNTILLMKKLDGR